jgi:pyruvate-formate lyase-activating enzyme
MLLKVSGLIAVVFLYCTHLNSPNCPNYKIYKMQKYAVTVVAGGTSGLASRFISASGSRFFIGGDAAVYMGTRHLVLEKEAKTSDLSEEERQKKLDAATKIRKEYELLRQQGITVLD